MKGVPGDLDESSVLMVILGLVWISKSPVLQSYPRLDSILWRTGVMLRDWLCLRLVSSSRLMRLCICCLLRRGRCLDVVIDVVIDVVAEVVVDVVVDEVDGGEVVGWWWN